MAITSGVRTIDGLSSGASGRSASKLSSRPHSEEAGDQATGSSEPRAIRACASPDAATWPATKTFLPSTSRPASLKRAISGLRSLSFSGE